MASDRTSQHTHTQAYTYKDTYIHMHTRMTCALHLPHRPHDVTHELWVDVELSDLLMQEFTDRALEFG
jgi:hypothetical protein